MNYQEAKNIFENSRRRKLANNTYLDKSSDQSYLIRLHGNIIIRFHSDRTVLSSCGWRTVTTKERLNRFTDFYVNQRKGVWFVSTDYNKLNADGVKCEVFADGITYDLRANKWLNVGNTKQTGKLRKQIKQYAKDFIVALEAGQVPKPSGADCWYCYLTVDKPEADKGKTLGDVVSNSDHIVQHIKEKYYVPSLCVNACKRFGVSKAAWWWLQGLWCINQRCDTFADVAKEQIERAIRRYCYQHTGSAS